MYEFLCDCIKPKYQDRTKLCYMHTDSFIIHVTTEDFYKDIANDVKQRFDTYNSDENDKRPLLIGKNKIVIGLSKDELGGMIMIEFVGLRAKKCAYLTDDASEHKKANGTKKCLIKRQLMFKKYKDCQCSNEIILKSQQRFKSDYHNVYTKQINKIALSSNNDKRLQTFDRIATYPYGTKASKVCEIKMLNKYK